MHLRAQQRSSTPTKVVGELTELRLEYATLLEAQGAIKVELRQKEAELVELRATSKETTEFVTSLLAKVDELNDIATKRERRAALAEREVSFLNAMVVCHICNPDRSHMLTFALPGNVQCGGGRQQGDVARRGGGGAGEADSAPREPRAGLQDRAAGA